MTSVTPHTNQTFPLTRSQTWVWAGQRLLPDSPMNSMSFAIELADVDGELLIQAITKMIEGGEALHLRLQETTGKPAWVVRPQLAPLSVEHLPHYSAEEVATLCRRRAAEERFSADGPLYATTVYLYADNRATWYLNQHHLITDGWSVALQVRYVLDAYAALRGGNEPPPIPFVAFTDYLASPPVVKSSVTEHWNTVASALPDPPKLYGRENPHRSSKACRWTTQLTEQQTAALDRVIQEPDVRNWSADLARYTVFATVLYALLYRIGDRDELVFGSPAHNRVRPADKRTPGLFMELFPQSVTVEPGETFATLLLKVKAATMDFLRYAQPGSSTAALARTFNVVLNYINQSFGGQGLPPTRTHWLHPGHTEPGLHLSLQVYDFDGTGRPTLSFDLNEAVFAGVPGEQPGRWYLDLLDRFLQDRNQPLVSAPARTQNATAKAPAVSYAAGAVAHENREKTLVDLFSESVVRYPDHPAAVFEDQVLSYRQLDERSNQVANGLLARGVGKGSTVPIALDRSLEMLVGLLGILKAGAAYAPIDPDYPAERIRYILENVKSELVLTTRSRRGKLSGIHSGKIVELDLSTSEAYDHPATAPEETPAPADRMYVLHTSGSTGRPKGVANRHDGVANRLLWGQDYFQLRAGKDAVLQNTTFCFDVSVTELFGPLIAGAKVVFVRTGGQQDHAYLQALLQSEGVTTINFVPTMLEVFLERELSLPRLKRVLCAGEALTPGQVRQFRQRLPNVELHNLYGPTEAAITVTHWRAPDDASELTVVPIGTPTANARLCVLDRFGQPAPLGATGELAIGGIQVAEGYLNRPELTADRFVTRRLFADADAEPERLYLTGDLARMGPGGTVEYLGRIDGQVKLRGFRVELGEIASVLQEIPQVRQVQVLLKGEGVDAYLAAFVVAGAPDFDLEKARAYLADRVPEYMIPAQFVKLEAIPQLPNGKADRKALAALDPLAASGEEVAPNGEFEKLLHEIWTETLQIEEISVTRSFHELGGQSLMAIRLTNRINEAFELELPANVLFQYPTIRGLARHLESVIRRLLAEMETDD